MTVDSFCNTCNKSLNHRNSIRCNLCLIQTYFKCKNLNFVDDEVIKNSNKSLYSVQCSKRILHEMFLIVNRSEK